MAASKRQRRVSRNQSALRRAAIESLEQRLVFSTITVNTLIDSEAADDFMSLREALALMNFDGDPALLGRSLTEGELARIDTTEPFGTNNRILFDDSLHGETIELNSTLSIWADLTIDGGENEPGIELRGGGPGSDYRAFNIWSGDVTIQGLAISEFRTTTFGGAISLYAASLTIRDSEFHGNRVDADLEAKGGAIESAGNLTIIRSDFTENIASSGNGHGARGGALSLGLGTVTIEDSTFIGNEARGGADLSMSSTSHGGNAYGGAIYTQTDVTIIGSTFIGNFAEGGEAAATDMAQGGDGLGGAINAMEGTLTLINSTLTENIAQGGSASSYVTEFIGWARGGALSITNTSLTINFSTIWNNYADADHAAALYFWAVDTGLSLTINNSILSQPADSGIAVDFTNNSGDDVTTSGANNLFGEMTGTSTPIPGISHTDADPMLDSVDHNGGPTMTMKPQAGSPAIDAAGDTDVTTDQRGRARVVGVAADIGAFELDAAPTITTADDSTIFIVDGYNEFTFETATDGSTPTLSYLGDLPAGVDFIDNGDGTATLIGSPEEGAIGVYNLTIIASNGFDPDAELSFTLTVNALPFVTSVPEAVFNPAKAGTFTITTTGVPTPMLSYTGTLPAGLTFHDNGDGTATISGTTTVDQVGEHWIDVYADNGMGDEPRQQNLLIIVEPLPTSIVTAGGGKGGSIAVKDADGSVKFTIENPFPASSTPRRLAMGDLSDDGFAEIIIACGKRTPAKVYVYDGQSGNVMAEIDPFGNYKGGVYVTTGDVDNDGVADVIVSAGKRPGSKATIRVYSGATFDLIADVWAFDAGAEIRLASADLDGDGHAEVIAAKGNKVRVFDGLALSNNTVVIQSEFKPFAGYTGGLFVAAGDTNNDGQADIIVSQGGGARPWITVFNGNDNSLQRKFRVNAFSGTTIACDDYNSDGYDDIVAVTKTGRKNTITVFSGLDDSILETIETDEKGRLFIA